MLRITGRMGDNVMRQDHCTKEHADLIRPWMPERELEEGNWVWNHTDNRKELIATKNQVDWYKTHPYTILYTFSEIWEELPDERKECPWLWYLYLSKYFDHKQTVCGYRRGEEAKILFKDPIPANAAAELLIWVRRRQSHD